MSEMMQEEGVDRSGATLRWRMWARRLAWVIAVMAALGVAFAWLWPDVGDDGRLVGAVNWLVFVFRTYSLQAGLVLIALSVVVVLVRAWRPAAVLLIAGVVCVAPAARSYLPAERAAVDSGPGAAIT